MIATHVVEFDLDVSVPSEVAATTGKLDFAECLRLCRVLFSAALGKIKHSAKVALPSAALGKIKHSAKVALPSARHSVKPGSRQNWALPSAAALGKRWPARDGGHLPSDFAECLTADTRQIFF